MLERLRSALEIAIATHAPDRVFLHAGAVADGEGRAVLLPGRSSAGKTTLVGHS
jgi:hypothetical protein